MMNMKQCKKCNVVKDEEEFKLVVYPSGNSGRARKCIKCQSAYKKEWAEKDPVKNAAVKRKYYDEHRDECLERAAKQNKTDKYMQYKHQYNIDHKEELSAKEKQKRIDDGDNIRAKEKRYRKEHPEIYTKSRRKPETRLSNLRSAAKSRNIECNLTIEEYNDLTSINCYYCDYRLGKRVEVGSGLDRINNNKGYTNDNCISSCKECNMIRGSFLTMEETKILISAILLLKEGDCAKNQSIIIRSSDNEVNDAIIDRKFVLKEQFRCAKKQAKRSEHNWSITFEDYISVILEPCYYCNNELGAKVYSSVGLDRIDNEKDYHIDNVVSCCRACNSIKRDLLTQAETKVGIEAVLEYRRANVATT